MSLQFRVVPNKKRRGPKRGKTRKSLPKIDLAESWTDASSRQKRIFNDLPQNVQEHFEAICTLAAYTKGEIIFAEGHKPEGVFLLHSGSVKLSAGSADGRSIILGSAEAGEILGLASAISGKLNEMTAEALKPVQCSFIERTAFLNFLCEHGSATLRVAEILSNMYHVAFDQARYLGLSAGAAEKLARLLLDSRTAQSPGNGNCYPLTHKEIGEMVGLSRETVTRVLARFKRANLIESYNSGFRVVDRFGLQQLLM